MILTTAAYANSRRITPQAVRNWIYRGKLIPGVYKMEKIGRKYFLYTNLKNETTKRY